MANRDAQTDNNASDERHAAYIGDWLEDGLVKFDIPPQKEKAVVHDNGANVVAAVKILVEKHGRASALHLAGIH